MIVDPDLLATAWQGVTKSELDSMLGGADFHIRGGDFDAAGQMLRQVWTGYKAILGQTHEEANLVAYRLASFYAEQDKLDSAHEIIDETSRLHIEKLGIDDRRSWQHVLHVVELLNAWNRPTEALAFLARAKDYVKSVTPTTNRKGNRRARSLNVQPVTAHNLRLLEVAQNIVDDQSSEQIEHGLELAHGYVATSDQSVQPLLIAILQQCGHDTDKLAKHRLKTSAELLKLYVKLDIVWDNIARLDDAAQAFDDILIAYPWNTRKFKSLEIMEALLELAAAFVRCKRDDLAEMRFRQAVDQAEILYGTEDERTIWILISVGLVYQALKSWDMARPWFEQALAGALTAYDKDDGIVSALEAAMENRHFAYLADEGRPFKTVFGVDGIVIRPGRLRIE